ncbi:uncharacterized protein LOC103511101 [Diaphorina citri]|uniref:Uncharacterized protein LOC103511101 n=1 Tax=Diaphorina citri TaxID=121845 RepID=A0A1S3D466_DIACI|nr:uncharacterized protein LOC103511101 [Diaphorina citri]
MRNTTRQEPQGQENRNSLDSASYNTLIIHEENRLSGAGTPPGYQISKVSSPVPSSIKSPSVAAVASSSSDSGVREITQIPDDYLSQSQVLKHLAKEVKVVSPGSRDDEVNNAGSSTSSAGKHYQSYSTTSSGKSKKTRSKSQPDLSQLELAHKGDSVPGNSLGASSSRKEQRCMQMIERLMQENSGLKMELEACYQRVSKSQKLEQEVGKVHRAHEDLVESCERRERLERAARVRLQGEVRRLQEANRSLQSHAELLSNQVVSLRGADSALDVPEIARREALISQLIAQNKELIAAKDRQEIELAAQRATLEEQRTHIDILDTALTNAQSNVVRLEEECRKKQLYVERVAQLQRALSSLQLASDRREQTERKLRLQLERELRNERARNSNTQDTSGSDGDPGENIAELKRRLREKDEKIMRLEGEVAKWEQRYLEESELRQAAIDAASIPKDAKIAALEKTSMESEKLIAEARSDKLKQMDEVHAANKKVSDLESRMKELESKLAERDAMIRVLQKKHHGHHTTYEKDYLHHSPRSSELTTDDLVGPVSSGSVFTTSTGFGSSASYTGSVDSAFHHHHSHSTRSNKYSSSANQSFDAKSLDDQLKELDSQLLSKRGLCCFPGFSHPSASTRKGKISQPLLASVTSSSLPLFEPSGFLQGLVSGAGSSRPDDMLLLEKQGLCSQQQRQPETSGRCVSLPPSSLPRPKRQKQFPSSKLGEYGRLSDSESGSRKLSTDSEKTRESPTNTPHKLGEYGRLSDSQERKTPTPTPSNDSKQSRESNLPMPKYVSLGDRRKLSPSPAAEVMEAARESPSRKFPPYGRYSEERKVSGSPTLYCPQPRNFIYEQRDEEQRGSSKSRENSFKSLLPPPRKISDYGCFMQDKSSSNIESKLRIFSPNAGMRNRRGSLQRESPSPKLGQNESNVRSLPSPNKYRIQF